MRSHVAFLIWVWNPLPDRRILEIVRLTTIHNGPKWTISVSSRLGLLHSIRARHRVVYQRGRWPLRGWIVRSPSVGEGNETFLIRVWKPLPNTRVLKTMKLTTIRSGPKQTISVSGGFRLSRMVLQPDTEWCTSEDTGP